MAPVQQLVQCNLCEGWFLPRGIGSHRGSKRCEEYGYYRKKGRRIMTDWWLLKNRIRIPLHVIPVHRLESYRSRVAVPGWVVNLVDRLTEVDKDHMRSLLKESWALGRPCDEAEMLVAVRELAK